MKENDFANIGEQIRETVQSAIDTMDFKQLNDSISNTVNSALEEAKKQLTERTMEWKASCRSSEYHKYTTPHQMDAAKEKINSQKVIVKHTGRMKGIMYTLFGGVGVGVTASLILAVLLVGLILNSVGGAIWGLLVFLIILEVLFSILLAKGNSIRWRLKRLKIYLKQADGKAYCQIQKLAEQIGKSKQFVITDLNKMMRNGMLPEAHIDEQRTCLMLNAQIYQQYLETQEALKDRQRSEAKTRENKEVPEQENASMHSELSKVMDAGRNYIRVLREANNAIPGEVISAKLYRLEAVISKIFDSVDRHPEQLEEMQKFMEYYLPTTVKLVNAYRDFDRVEIQGENITMAKREIEGTIDTINLAFERFLDDLYQDAAFDASTDASVLQTMLKKEGWTESDFNRRTTP